MLTSKQVYCYPGPMCELCKIISGDGETKAEQISKIEAAVWSGDSEMTRRLLDTLAFTMTDDGDFMKELVVSAVYSKSGSVIKCLFDKYPELIHCEYQMTYNVGQPVSCSLLHHAAEAGSKDIVEFLVHSGLDVKQRTSEEETVLGIAASKAHLDVVEYLLNTQSTDDLLSLGAEPIVSAGAGGSVEIFNKLVNVGFNPLDSDKHQHTTLHMALRAGKEELAFYIMKQYPMLLPMTGQYGRSALHCAATGESIELVRHLVNLGFDTRYVDWHGDTILHIACLHGQKDIVTYMTKHLKNLLHIKAYNGTTALHHASEFGNVDIFKHLVTAGLNAHDRDINQTNTQHYACYRKKTRDD